MLNFKPILFAAIGSVALAVAFQNCAKGVQQFGGSDQVKAETACFSDLCVESLLRSGSTARGESLPEASSSTAQVSLPSSAVGGVSSVANQVLPSASSVTGQPEANNVGTIQAYANVNKLLNIGSGLGKQSCEDLIAEHYGKRVSCLLGGGCGISCGKPGGSCASANPRIYGACLTQAEMDAAPDIQLPKTAKAPSLYNFVAGNKATCEASIQSRLGLRAVCKIGGGCGLSCGVPSASCVSANPHSYGACLSQ